MNICAIVKVLVTLLVERLTVYCSINFNIGNNVKSFRSRFNILLWIMILVPLVLTLIIQVTTHPNEKLINNIYAMSGINFSNFNVVAAEDWRCCGNTKDSVDSIIKKNPDLALGLDDYSFRISISKEKNNNTNTDSSQLDKPRLMSDFSTELKIETILSGLESPTDMSFLKSDDIIIIEKDNGNVERIVNHSMLEKPLLDVNVSNQNERGLVGMATSTNNKTRNVFLYYTEANGTITNCTKSDYCSPEADPIGNRLYKYTLTQDGTELINQKLLLDLPAVPGPSHNGGKMTIGPDNNLYLVIGDLTGHKTKAQNYENGNEPDGTGGVLRTNQEGDELDEGYLGDEYPLNLYYAYGIRNSFGIDFDPINGNLWDTENGPDFGDEINLVKPGFNSGWKDVQGIWEHKRGKPQDISLNPENLEDFSGRGEYSDPEFTFFNTVGVTALKFFNSDKMGLEYKNDLFVGDIKNGKIYHFDLNDDRTSLKLEGDLADKIANSPKELEEITFADGFSGISDLEVGPDGYLYVLSYGKGAIYRIIPEIER